MLKSLFSGQFLTGFTFIFQKSVVNFDCAIPISLEASTVEWVSFAPLHPVSDILVPIKARVGIERRAPTV
ncbi:MAG: hypothetical protein PHT78_11670 [Desulfitobacteriaceae bacterium]|nr:hypothetical protein [Desulfitobacteriaceae bacterium]